MAATKGAGAKLSPDRRIARAIKISGLVLASLLAIGACVAVVDNTDSDSSRSVPVPTAEERADTVAVLQRAADAQNVCFGWELAQGFGSRVVSEGSNLGDGVAVDSDSARCPRWLRVVAEVTYTSESSESEDYAYVRVEESSGFSMVSTSGLERLGLKESTYIDDPGWAICRAAVFLPLLLAETGEVPPAPVASTAPTAEPKPLAAPGSDLWRDRWGYLVGGGVLLLATMFLVAIGWFERRHERRRAGGRAGPDAAATRRSSPPS